MTRNEFTPVCPVAVGDGDTVKMAHGGGGRAMARLLEEVFLPAFDNPMLARRHDGAAFEAAGACAFTTDSFVVQPLFFPGGDIGTLAVNGTVNDLAMCGARPLYLSAGFIIEEGLPLATLKTVVHSMRDASLDTDVQIVTGDVKVVDRGKADGLFINTAGVGRVVCTETIAPDEVRPGDAIILSGDIGRHGIAVMAAREGLGFETALESDCAAVVEPVLALLDEGVKVHCLRDLTRGGLASAAVEIAETAALELVLDETAIPVREDVRAACELLGLDPVYVANEGRFMAITAAEDAERALAILRRHEISAGAALIGRAVTDVPGRVSVRGSLGAMRVVDMLSGEQLPRIC